ncbi:hypothetical protein MXB_5538 [Myxobolus squamalis]|nr:hypothetical protein MXB_5538 [Myxobolus squamalis]
MPVYAQVGTVVFRSFQGRVRVEPTKKHSPSLPTSNTEPQRHWLVG